MMRSLLVITFCFALSGCDKGEPKSIDYYLRHSQELKEKIRACDNDPQGMGQTPDCYTAQKALFQKSFQGDAMPQISS